MTGRGSPSERLYTTLRAAILNGVFAPEQALKPQELANAEKVSLAVAREALLRLVGEGLAARLPNRGFAVPAVNAERWQQIAEARALTEPVMFRLSIERGGVDWEVRVRAAHHHLARTPPWEPGGAFVSDEWSEAHRQFHRALLEGCGNPVLLDGFDRTWTASELARRWSGAILPERDGPAEHAALEEAALSRDAERAAGLLARHVLHTAQGLTTHKD
ncbi:DNA-binding GntR family transcriptional regulator [Streptomyces aurantiacus]|uniref:GntR family transcriptional regulator n=1 Tax=Streptomyces aurantiacus TaxID=47760 RepID=UPI002792B894|nr:GntR family transcriptional regulator [Streptomyces aurantiacus]MDQ0778309.1 DNA-binding GntR family transcriptional regulator [Streptomyces aurantiacus]